MADSPKDARAFIEQIQRRGVGGTGGRFPIPPILIVALLAFLLGFAIPTPGSVVHVVYAGHVGVKAVWGQVQPDAFPPGVYILNPISDRIFDIDVRVLPHNFTEIDAASKEYQNVKMTGTMKYHIEPGRATDTYKGGRVELV